MQTITEEYNNEHVGNQQKAKSTAVKGNRSQYVAEQQDNRSRVSKGSRTKQALHIMKQLATAEKQFHDEA